MDLEKRKTKTKEKKENKSFWKIKRSDNKNPKLIKKKKAKTN
jgi:hypothetical protein